MALIRSLLSQDVQSFITAHLHDDPNQLHLKYKSIFNIPTSIVVDQIVGRKKAKEKLPTWYNNNQIIYPPALNIEQTSSEQAALVKIKILEQMLNTDLKNLTLLDLTGGFGVDSYFFSRKFKEIHLVEPNENLLALTKHNLHHLGVRNINYYHSTAEAFLESPEATQVFNLIFIDPSRRSQNNQKVFSLNQCDPDVIKLQHKIWHISDGLFVKSSPLLDINIGLKELLYVKRVNVTSIHNECKELLFFCEKNFESEPVIEATNLNDKEYSFLFKISEEQKAEVVYSDPLNYLYEPNASILKSGAFKTIAKNFNIPKLHPNTHLYTSNDLVENFPGRIFQIEFFLKSDKKAFENFFIGGKANIITRNYPLTVNELRKKIRLKDGGDKFLIGCSGMKKKFLLAASKLNGL